MLFLLSLSLCSELCHNSKPGLATISFDEGPSRNTCFILNKLKRNGIFATFYLDPEKITNKDVINEIIKDGQTLALAITNDISELSEEELELFLSKQKREFIDKTGVLPKYVRLPRIGYDQKAVNAAVKNGLIPTRPTLDSEDTDLPSFIEPFTNFVNQLDSEDNSISVVFRDRMGKTLEHLDAIINTLKENGFDIVGLGDFYGVCDRNESVCNVKENKDKDKKPEKTQSKSTDNGAESSIDETASSTNAKELQGNESNVLNKESESSKSKTNKTENEDQEKHSSERIESKTKSDDLQTKTEESTKEKDESQSKAEDLKAEKNGLTDELKNLLKDENVQKASKNENSDDLLTGKKTEKKIKENANPEKKNKNDDEKDTDEKDNPDEKNKKETNKKNNNVKKSGTKEMGLYSVIPMLCILLFY